MEELKAYTKRLFIRASNDVIFRDKLEKMLDELTKYSITRLDLEDDNRFKFQKILPRYTIPNELADYIDTIYDDSLLLERLESGNIPDKEALYAMVVAEALYINMTSVSIGIKIGRNTDYPNILLETMPLYRINLTSELMYSIFIESKDELMAMPLKEDIDTSAVTVNRYYVTTMKSLLADGKYTANELNHLYKLLCHFILDDKKLVNTISNWVTYGVLKIWSKLNLIKKG